MKFDIFRFGLLLASICFSSPALAKNDLGLCPKTLEALDPDKNEDFEPPYEPALKAAQDCTLANRPLGLQSQAYVLRLLDRPDEAREALSESIRLGGDLVVAKRLECAILADEKKFEEARAACEAAIAADRTRPLGYFGLGQLEFAAGHWEDALSAYQTASRLAGENDPTLWSLIGQTYNKMQQWDKGISSLKRAISYNPTYLSAQIELSWALVTSNRPEEVLKVTEAALVHNPKSSALHRWRGRGFEQLNKFAEAFEEYNTAIRLAPKWSAAYWERGTMHQKAGRTPEAVADFSQAIAIDPSFTQAHVDRGIIWRNAKRYGEAFQDFSKAIELNPKDSYNYSWRGIVLAEAGDDRALGDFEQALVLNSKNMDALVGRAYELFKLKRFEDAAIAYTSALQQDPLNQPSLFWRARTYTELGKSETAINDYSQLLSISPGYMWAYYNRGELLVNRGECEKALPDFEKFMTDLPGRAYPWTWSAYCVEKTQQSSDDWWSRHQAAWKKSPDTVDKHLSGIFYYISRGNQKMASVELHTAQQSRDDPMVKAIGKVFEELTKDELPNVEISPEAIERAGDEEEAYCNSTNANPAICG